jgi:hypothetical protein
MLTEPALHFYGAGLLTSRRRNRHTDLGFLGGSPFAAKTPVVSYWISLDFLVRTKTFQWVTRDESRKIFCGAFAPAFGTVATGDCGVGMRKGEVGHTASLA